MARWQVAVALFLHGELASGEPSCPRCNYELPKAYKVANSLSEETPVGQYRGEYFDVYSKPLRMRYGDVHTVFDYDDMVALPPHIVSRFNGSVMAITGFESIMTRVEDGVESMVPCTELYNHHWSNLMHGANSVALDGLDELPYWEYPGAAFGEGAGPTATLKLRPTARKLQKPAANHAGHHFPEWHELLGNSTPPTAPQDAQFFSEGNGNEHRLSFHGYPKGYAQLIRSPVAFSPGLMFINTKHPERSGKGDVLPRVALQPPEADYSALLECPCSTRRVMNATAGTIDGEKVWFGCVYSGVVSQMARENNTACQMETLHGGSKCCANGMVLLDADQPQPEKVDEYIYKTRFYFEEYSPGSHMNLFRAYWQSELKNNEFDVPACDPDTPPSQCIYTLSATFEAGDAKSGWWSADPTRQLTWPADGGGLKLIYAGGHCHVGCLSLELYNADTGKLICRNEPVHGTTTSELNDEPLNERGYAIAIPPCLWGDDASEEGLLQKPPIILPSMRLTTIARYNSTKLRQDQPLPIAHYAVMAMWQMRATYVGKQDIHI